MIGLNINIWPAAKLPNYSTDGTWYYPVAILSTSGNVTNAVNLLGPSNDMFATMQGNSIITVSYGDVLITPNGSGIHYYYKGKVLQNGANFYNSESRIHTNLSTAGAANSFTWVNYQSPGNNTVYTIDSTGYNNAGGSNWAAIRDWNISNSLCSLDCLGIHSSHITVV